ncbi:uncharacterized protein LOC141912893 [Tubulanus polymorphus]|uniref:uncharacterized protein LOC141912893 n=1 Tax=Tubulanus polymorphus TaxID=672921 RepID=UPI003DA1F609
MQGKPRYFILFVFIAAVFVVTFFNDSSTRIDGVVKTVALKIRGDRKEKYSAKDAGNRQTRNRFSSWYHSVPVPSTTSSPRMTATTMRPIPRKKNFEGVEWKVSAGGLFPTLQIGGWQVVDGRIDVRLHTAFLDDRPELVSDPLIRITSVASMKITEQKMYCVLWFDGDFFAENDTVSMQVNYVGPWGAFSYGINYDHYVLACPVTNSSRIPSHVSIITRKGEQPTTLLAVEKPEKPGKRQGFATCVATRYGHLDAYRLIEWMELQYILGVRLVGIYANGVDSLSDKVFRFYQKSGLVDYRTMGTPLGDNKTSSVLLGEKTSFNNCLLRNMYSFDYITVVDTDEIIIPQKPEHRTYEQLIGYLIAKHRSPNSPAPSFMFRNAYYWTNFSPDDEHQPKQLATLRVLNRLPPSLPGYSVKSILDPRSCLLTHSHYCLFFAAKFDGKNNVVSPEAELGLNHHYKDCHFDSYYKKKGLCEEGRRSLQRSPVMLKYKDALIPKIMKTAHVIMFGLLVVAATVVEITAGAKVLMISPPENSHMQQLIVIGDALVRQHGHEVSFIAPTTVRNSPILAETSVDLIWYEGPVSFGDNKTAQQYFLTLSLETSNPVAVFRFAFEFMRNVCETVLSDRVLFEKLRDRQFDFGLIDGIFFTQCFYILFDNLEIPYATVVTLTAPDQIISSLSIPSLKIMDDVVEKLDFKGRVVNTLVSMIGYGLFWWVSDPSSFYERHCRTKPCPSFQRLQADSKIWLIDDDELFHVPAPSMPHVFNVGGLSVRPTKSLTGDIKTIADNAVDSLVLVSFGGTVSYLADVYLNKIIEAMRALPRYTFIFKFKQKIDNAPKNVKIVDWLPQRDILAHKNTRLFVTHCGNAAIHETLYAGVPVVAIPFYGDQPTNAQKMKHRGYGVDIRLVSATDRDLIAAIEEVINNPVYRRNMQKSSAIYRDKKFASERAGKIVDNILKHGSEHIQPPAKDLYLFQLLLLDVIAFFVLIAAVFVIVTCVCLRICYRKCYGIRQPKTKAA